MTQRDRLLTVLHERNLVDLGPPVAGKAAVAHCHHADTCWSGVRKRARTDEIGHVPLPWVGKKYKSGGLAAVGVNMNDFGGLDANEELIPAAAKEMAAGRKRVRFEGNGRWSTALYHRLTTYAQTILAVEDTGIEKVPLHDVFDHFAYTNQIACSPQAAGNGDRSKPRLEMWEHCGRHILRPMLDALKPRVVLVLGNGDNAWSMLNRVYGDRKRATTREGKNWVTATQLEDGPLLLAVPHPSYFKAKVDDVKGEITYVLSRENQ